jgi:hypothetical protein
LFCKITKENRKELEKKKGKRVKTLVENGPLAWTL